MIGFIKKNWLTILLVSLIIVVLFVIHSCVDKSNIEEMKKDHELRMKKLTDEGEIIKGKLIESDIKIKDLEYEESKHLETRANLEKEIYELKKNYKVIPIEKKPFKELSECQLKFDNLQIDYNKKLTFIIKLELKLKSYIESELNWNEQKKEYKEKELHWIESEKNLNDKIFELKLYSGKLEKKQRKPFFSIILGGFISTSGRFSIGIGGGVNISGLLRSIL